MKLFYQNRTFLNFSPTSNLRASFSGPGGLKETKMFLPHPLVKLSFVGSLRDREVACSPSELQGLNSNPVSRGRCHLTYLTMHPREVFMAQFSLYVHKSGLKPDSFHFISL